MADVAAPSAPGRRRGAGGPGRHRDRPGCGRSASLHAHVLEALGPRDHARLLDLLDGTDAEDDGELPCRVA